MQITIEVREGETVAGALQREHRLGEGHLMQITIEVREGETVAGALQRELTALEEFVARQESSQQDSVQEISSDEVMLTLVKRAVDKKGLGLDHIKSLLNELGVTRASLLSPAQKEKFVSRLKAALGE